MDPPAELLELAWLEVEAKVELCAEIEDEVTTDVVVDDGVDEVEDPTNARYPPAAAIIRIITITTTVIALETALNWLFLILRCGARAYSAI